MFDRFTEKAIKSIMLAQEEARRLGHSRVGTEQILLGLIGEGTGVAAQALSSCGVKLKDARVEVEKQIGRGSGPVKIEIPFTDEAKTTLELSWAESKRLKDAQIDTQHLLLAILRNDGCQALSVLQELGVSMLSLESKLLKLCGKEE